MFWIGLVNGLVIGLAVGAAVLLYHLFKEHVRTVTVVEPDRKEEKGPTAEEQLNSMLTYSGMVKREGSNER